ncbi:hypothetical protein [Prevotella sp.]|uniref:hypothetical protein n=1 Tax=Prevotella sp. TaxID=59823 RepID=UPI003AB21C6B
MRRYIKVFIICLTALAAVSCSNQHKAESVVKDFLDANMMSDDYSISFYGIDSTRNITDSMINVMKINAKKNSLFKKNIAYGTNKGKKPYIFTKTRIFNGKDTVPYTFYLDKAMQNVIAFKMN